jgi:hypothetical protein
MCSVVAYTIEALDKQDDRPTFGRFSFDFYVRRDYTKFVDTSALQEGVFYGKENKETPQLLQAMRLHLVSTR